MRTSSTTHYIAITVIVLCALCLAPMGARTREASAQTPRVPGRSDVEQLAHQGKLLPPFFALPEAQGGPRFHGNMAGGQVVFDSAGLTLALQQPNSTASAAASVNWAARQQAAPVIPEKYTSVQTLLQLRYLGANQDVQLEGIGPQATKVNYYVGADPAQWQAGLETFDGIAYHGLYGGIDVAYEQTDSGLKSTFTVAPGANPSLIRWRYEGATQPKLDAAQTAIELNRPASDASTKTMVERAPLAWQDVSGRRVYIPVHFDVAADGSIGFDLGTFDASQPLIIDPFLEYSTFFGRTGMDEIWDIAVDASGAAYVTGVTDSTNLPVTPGSWDNTFNGVRDVFIAKLNAGGTAMDYVTYIGGNDDERGYGIALDSANNAVVTGSTWSSDFPITQGVVATTLNYYATYVVKVNGSGALVLSTYLAVGGSVGQDVKLDSQNNIYVVGTTASSLLSPTAGAFQTMLQGEYDVYLAKLNSTATSVLYLTYIGGSGTDEGMALDLNGPNQVYITGHTDSSNFPTVNAFQPTQPSNTVKDAFVLRLDINPTSLVFSTYLGGNSTDYGWDLDIGPLGSVYIAGTTSSSNFPVSSGAFDNTPWGVHGYVAKFNSVGGRVFIARVGNGYVTEAHRLAVDGDGKTYFVGTVLGGGLPELGAWHHDYAGDYDGYVAELNADGTALDYLTYIGGSGADCLMRETPHECSIALGPNNTMYVAGMTNSQDFPTTSNAIDQHFDGISANDGFILSLSNNTYSVRGQIVNRYASGVPDGNYVLSDKGGYASVVVSGVYVMWLTEAGTHILRPVLSGSTADRYFVSPESRAVTIPPSVTDFDFELIPYKPLYSISGTIKSNSGQAFAGVNVVASSGESGVSDSLGVYTIPISLTGTYVLTPFLSGYVAAPITRTVQIQYSSVGGTDFTMTPIPPPVYSITGVVALGSIGTPATNVKVTATGGQNSYVAYTNGAGEYTIGQLPAGSYALSVELSGYIGTPSSYAVTVPPPVGAQNFTLVPLHKTNYIYASIIARDFTVYYPSYLETEPNNVTSQANGFIAPGAVIYGLPNDDRDYFSIFLSATGNISVTLQDHTGKDVQLQLFYQVAGNRPVPSIKKAPYSLTYKLAPPGVYYVYIFTGSGYNTTKQYQLKIMYP